MLIKLPKGFLFHKWQIFLYPRGALISSFINEVTQSHLSSFLSTGFCSYPLQLLILSKLCRMKQGKERIAGRRNVHVSICYVITQTSQRCLHHTNIKCSQATSSMTISTQAPPYCSCTRTSLAEK